MRAIILAAAMAFGVQGAIGPVRPGSPPLAADPAGLSIVLLLDVTASNTRGPLAIDQRLARVLDAFLQGLAPGDRGAVGVVTRRIRISTLMPTIRDLATTARALISTSAARPEYVSRSRSSTSASRVAKRLAARASTPGMVKRWSAVVIRVGRIQYRG